MTNRSVTAPGLKTYLQQCQERIQGLLQTMLQAPVAADQLNQAMLYSLLNGGKRIRPTLVYASAEAFGIGAEQADAPACALELMHCYSLIHDDLPAMDDDDLRRGQPSCHRAFGEASAILAGDALQSLAFEQLANAEQIPAPSRCQMIAELARASGHRGMAGGQSLDLQAVGRSLGLEALETMHRLKTGALIQAAVKLGAILGQATEDQKQALDRYALAIGLAFQVQDDILDVEGDTATLGKQSGADQALDKPTYPALLGLPDAKQKALSLHQQALDALKGFDERANWLRSLSEFTIQRNA